jgi:hypothetical protein
VALVYEIVRIAGLRPSERRCLVLLACDSDSEIDAVAVFDGLSVERSREVRSRFETWIDGVQHNNRWFHGFDQSGFRDCIVFKWKHENMGQRLYGFLCHPMPTTRRRFELCVLTNHGEKPHQQWETDLSELNKAKSLSADSCVRATIQMEFPDQTTGAKSWKQ